MIGELEGDDGGCGHVTLPTLLEHLRYDASPRVASAIPFIAKLARRKMKRQFSAGRLDFEAGRGAEAGAAARVPRHP